MVEKEQDQREFEEYFEEKSRKPEYVEPIQSGRINQTIEEVPARNLAIRILKSIGIGIMFFFCCLPALPWVVGFYIFTAIFLNLFFPHLAAIIWTPFTIILFIAPFLIGFVSEFFNLLDD